MNQINIDSKWIGVPFLWEGIDSRVGMDCATFVQAFLSAHNVVIPCPENYDDTHFRHEPQQLIRYLLKYGEKITGISNFKPLDIVVFSVKGKVAHVGVYVGYGKFIHLFANRRSGIDRLVGTQWGQILYCAIRPTKLIGNNDPVLEVPEEVKVGEPITLTAFLIAAVVSTVSFELGVILFASAILTFASTLLASRPKMPDVPSARYGFGPLQNTATSELPVPVLYGRLKVAGNAIYQSDPAETIYRCDSLCEGVCNAVGDVKVNDIYIEDVNTQTPAFRINIFGTLVLDYTPPKKLSNCSYTWYSGDAAQNVDARFSSEVPGLRNTAYLALTLATGEDLKGGFPVVTAIVDGTKIKTNSGGVWSGSTATSNPAACIRDFLTNSRYGIGMDESLIDDSAFGEAYDYCAALVSDGEGSTEARYRCDYTIDAKRPALDILEDMLATCNGVLVWSGNALRLKLDKAENSIQDFDMDNIRESSFSYQYISKDALANRIKLQYIDAVQNWTKVFAIAENKADQDLRASKEGGNGVIEKELSVLGITKFSRAVRLAYASLRKLQACNVIVSFTVATDAIHCEPWDVVEVTHDVSAWTKKKFRIVSIGEAENDEMVITAVEYNSSIYDDAYSATIVSYDYGTPTNPQLPLPNVTSLTVTESKYVNKDGVFVSDLDVAWTGITSGNEYFRDYVVKLKKGGGGYETVGTTVDTDFTIPNVEAAQTYYVKIISASIYGYLSTGTTSSPITTAGKSSLPGDVAGFTNTFTDEITLSWTPSPSGDLWGYELRDNDLGWGSGDAHLLWRGNAERFVIARPSSRAPGAHYIKAIDNSGNYSTAAASTTPTNAAPAQPTISGTDFFDVAKLAWTDVGDKDLKFYEVWKSTTNSWGGEETREKKVTAGIYSGGISTIVNGPTASGDTFYWKVGGVDTYGSGDLSTAYTNAYVGIASGDITNEAIHARHLTAVELITLSAQIKTAIINSAHILELSGDKIVANSITLGQLAPDATPPVTYYQSAEPGAGMVSGDYWVDTDDDLLYMYNGSAWVAVGAAAGGVQTFRQSAVPVASGAGDMWVDSDDDKLYRATTAGDDEITAGEWELIDARVSTGWSYVGDVTKIDGGDIQTNTVTANAISVAQLDALTINTGSLKVDEYIQLSGGYIATQDRKTYISGDVIEVRDESNNLRVKMGNLA